MARPTKRKHAETAAAQPISNFGRVSKNNILQSTPGKKVHSTTEPASSKKRKASAVDEDDIHVRLTPRTVSFHPSSDEETDHAPSKRTCRRQQEPQLGRTSSVAKSTPSAKSVKGKRVARETPSRAESAHRPSEGTILAKARQSTRKTVQSKIDANFKKSLKEKKAADNGFSPELGELVDLHKAFVKTIMIQMAHEGSNVPFDIRALTPNISRTWGKRQVTIEDIRRCVAIQSSSRNGTTSPFIITDYGRNKVCIELDSSQLGNTVNEDKLCKQFEDNLRLLCTEHKADEMTDVDIPLEGLSLGDLPQAEITNRDLGLKANPVLARGQRALTELKNDAFAKHQEKQAKQQAAANPMLNPDGSKMSLLDRLRFKQLAKENGPLPPSGPELERRAALNRVMDVTATINMLCMSKPPSLPRQAFPMQAILERLKDSLRTPLSNQEASRCVHLIATEVAPEWLRVVTIGGRENVVAQRNHQPVDRVIQERVQKLM